MADSDSVPPRAPRLADRSTPGIDHFDERPITEVGKPLVRAWDGQIPFTGPGHDTVPPRPSSPTDEADEVTSDWPQPPATDIVAYLDAITDVYQRTDARPPRRRPSRHRDEIDALLRDYLDDDRD